MKNKLKKIGIWFLQIIMGIQFILAGQAKFTRPEAWEKQFRNWGYPDHFYMVIGALEVIGAVLLFFPKLASKAALGLGVIMLGATVTHIAHAQWDGVTVTVILTALLGLLYYVRKGYGKKDEMAIGNS
ncbi:MAG: DoxX family protein [Bacteroidota bacterium]